VHHQKGEKGREWKVARSRKRWRVLILEKGKEKGKERKGGKERGEKRAEEIVKCPRRRFASRPFHPEKKKKEKGKERGGGGRREGKRIVSAATAFPARDYRPSAHLLPGKKEKKKRGKKRRGGEGREGGKGGGEKGRIITDRMTAGACTYPSGQGRGRKKKKRKKEKKRREEGIVSEEHTAVLPKALRGVVFSISISSGGGKEKGGKERKGKEKEREPGRADERFVQ